MILWEAPKPSKHITPLTDTQSLRPSDSHSDTHSYINPHWQTAIHSQTYIQIQTYIRTHTYILPQLHIDTLTPIHWHTYTQSEWPTHTYTPFAIAIPLDGILFYERYSYIVLIHCYMIFVWRKNVHTWKAIHEYLIRNYLEIAITFDAKKLVAEVSMQLRSHWWIYEELRKVLRVGRRRGEKLRWKSRSCVQLSSAKRWRGSEV